MPVARRIGAAAIGAVLVAVACGGGGDDDAATTSTPPTTATTAPTTTAAPPPPTYVVQQGDSLSGIAQQFGVSLDAIVAANGIANPNEIPAGLTLIIPTADAPAPTEPEPAAGAAPTEPPPAG